MREKKTTEESDTRSIAELARDPEYMKRLNEAMDNLTFADIAAVCERVVNQPPESR